jgi:hypothetical protein
MEVELIYIQEKYYDDQFFWSWGCSHNQTSQKKMLNDKKNFKIG